MDDREVIDQYDLVEIFRVPEEYKGVMDIGDIGMVIEKYDDESFEIECLQPGGSSKWLETLNIQSIQLKSKDPFSNWAQKLITDRSITRSSISLGAIIGAFFGALIGAGLGAITKSLNGILTGLMIGLLLGVVTGALTAALTVRTAGTTGGVGVGYFTGMVFGGVIGLILGALTPTPVLMSAHTEGLPLLDALTMGRFATAILSSFLLSILATIVGVWIGGRNQVPRNLRERYRL